ncbi:GcrA family cell cycle regulator [Hirschia baltica]|uniref:GcrA cell cycle regulator n=1 Tax=Hirschia baltica (strain ATCC 49814 / DSM 5838 / IFAM 1418) TaxID=582402 RepID=C6XMA0_HIRBI|nr:GcrA family cell cycle regulator [Hirschia baltica]ACT58043.1 GcrA cell cycle regulator [Hirschia baltica ATCC 49814]
MAWTEERVTELKKLWAEGHSASQIAKQLGGVTRNAVIGKVHRLGLSGRATPSRPVKRPPRLARPKPQVTQPIAATAKPASSPNRTPKESLPALPSRMAPAAYVKPKRLGNGDMVTVMTVSDSMCKWPIGDPADPDFGFCGHSSDGDSPYCSEHAKLAFQPSKRKRTNTYGQATRMAG